MNNVNNQQNAAKVYEKKLKVKFQGTEVLVRCKLGKDDQLNQRDLQVFDVRFIHGISKPKFNGKKIEYHIPASKNLLAHLQSGLTMNDFFVLFAQFVECLKKINHYGFNINNFVLDTNYMFYNPNTREVHFLYIPILNNIVQNNIYVFIYNFINQFRLRPGENPNFINNFISFIRQTNAISPMVLEEYIIKVYPQVYRQVKRFVPGQSQSLTNNKSYFEKKYDETGGHIKNEGANYPVNFGNSNSNNFDYKENNGNKISNEYEEQTGLLGEDDPYQDESNLDTVDTGLLVEEKTEHNSFDYEDFDGSNETTVLSGTSVIKNNQTAYPYMLRLNNYEKVFINKPSFRIGKERSYVDYFVVNNTAVSRIHADIITENGKYYIIDNNSTNHTFINGKVIPENQKVQLSDGDAVMLANEPFEFHIV